MLFQNIEIPFYGGSMTHFRPGPGKTALVGAAITAVITLSACGSSAGSGSSGGEYKIGFSGDLTAETAAIGNGMLYGIKTEIDSVNANGGVNGHKIDLLVTDDASDLSKGQVAAQTYRGDGVLAIVGANESEVWTPLAPVVAGYPMVLISVALDDSQTYPAHAYLYRSNLGPTDFPLAQIGFTKDYLIPRGSVPKDPKVAIFGYSSPATTGDVQALSADAPKLGWKIVGTQTFSLTATSATTQAAAIAAAKPDVVFSYLLDSDAIFAVQELRQAGYNGPIVDFVGADGISTFSGLDENNYYSQSSFAYPEDASNPGAVAMLKEAKKTGNDKYNTTPFFTQGYLQAVAVVDALKKCPYSTCTAKTLNSALQKVGTIPTDGLTSNWVITSTRHQMPGTAQFYVWDSATKSVKAVGPAISVPTS
jgi:branched-chain amino acid transport system substrate-binding protein